MKKHNEIIDLLTGAGSVEHHEHFLTFIETLKNISEQDLDGSLYVGSIFEIMSLFLSKFDCFMNEFVNEMSKFLKEQPFLTQMSFIQYCPDEHWKLSLVDALICVHTDRTLVPIVSGNKKWREYLKRPASYDKFEFCILALRQSYVSKDLMNWLSFAVTTYARLLEGTTGEPSFTLKERANAYVDDIFGWWKKVNADEDEIDSAIPPATLVVLPILPSLI